MHVTRPVSPAVAHELDQRELDPARLEIQVEVDARGRRQRQDLGDRRRARRIGAVVVGDEDAVAPAPHVHLEHVRAALDRGRERLEGVLGRARAVAAVRDAEGLGADAQRSVDQGASPETSIS